MGFIIPGGLSSGVGGGGFVRPPAVALPTPPAPNPLLWLEEGQSALYQDAGRTTLVTGDGDVIGSINDLSGNDNHPTAPGTGNRPVYRVPGLGSLNEWDYGSSATCSLTDVLTLPDGGVGDWARTQAFTVSAVVHTDNKPNNRNYVGKNVPSGSFEGWHQGLRTGTDRPFFRMFDTGGGQLFVEMVNAISNSTWQALTWTYDGSSSPGGLTGYVGTVSQSLNTVANTLTGDITNSIPFGVGLNYAGLTAICQNGLDGGLRALFVYDSELTGGDLTAVLNHMDALT